MTEVLTLIADGFNMKMIADILGISQKTVHYHWALIKQKMHFRSYADTVRYAIKHGLTTL